MMKQQRNFNQYLKQAQIEMRKYLVVFEKTKTGYSSYAPDLPGAVATGKTKSIVEKNIFNAIQFQLEGLKEENFRMPVAKAESEMLVFPL